MRETKSHDGGEAVVREGKVEQIGMEKANVRRSLVFAARACSRHVASRTFEHRAGQIDQGRGTVGMGMEFGGSGGRSGRHFEEGPTR